MAHSLWPLLDAMEVGSDSSLKFGFFLRSPLACSIGLDVLV
jgi:hypothetical protein